MKQGTTSKVNCILFNRLLSPVLLNKSGIARAKAVNFNSIFKKSVSLITTSANMAGFHRRSHITGINIEYSNYAICSELTKHSQEYCITS